ncbi:hypothetical protein DH2020_031453 [Rehmannia glutinosa]|uniref:Leucine-rich repeat-containing N-terminal plant-type domain-containing protein n=1 Tax=Rehmannia glutinosa TaxID=99300 RepID=A0ABR0VHZ0_REHGL
MIDHKGIISVNFLVLVLLCMEYDFVYVSGEARCIERERQVLLRFKKGLIDDFILSSWRSDNIECCNWRGVLCSNTTSHVIALQLPGDDTSGYYLEGEISSVLIELHDHLNILDLSGNDFGSTRIPEFIGSMTNLQHLNLRDSNFAGNVPPQIGNLTNLQTLDLSYNNFGGNRIPEFIGSMKNLQHLNLGHSNFAGNVPFQLGNLTDLRTLDLSHNYDIRFENLSWISHLSFLSQLDLSYSINLSNIDWVQQILLKFHSLQELHLQGCGITNVVTPYLNSSSISLSNLDLSENELNSSTIDRLFNSINVTANLRKLYLRGNKLERLPSSITRLPNLEDMDVSFNSMEGIISEADLAELRNLKVLDLSFNSLILNISPVWSPPFPQMDAISLAGCKMGSHFPEWLKTLNKLSWLDLSCARLSGEVPDWLWTNLSPWMQYLNLSHNHFIGTIPDFSSKSTQFIDVSSNNFSGPVPLFPPSTRVFQLSQNAFSGSISTICAVHSYDFLMVIDLSDNRLAGELPNCWENMTQLEYLNLANNNFSGEIPRSVGSLFYLETLHIRNNSFSGELPSDLRNCENLGLIDIGDNMFTGNIPTWVGAFNLSIRYLSFGGNRFHGIIPLEICSLTQIQILDLSRNNISGNVPSCFDNFTWLVEKNTTSVVFTAIGYVFTVVENFFQEYVDYASVSWKGQESEYYTKNLRLLKLIDLSSNRLVGNIPETFSSLKGLVSLNLSRNSLTGSIKTDIGQMEMLEVLDLSSNHLSGGIPIGLGQLHYLDVLDLANNDLSGEIPSSTQLQSFNASVFAGNSQLCGRPLALCPGEGPDPSTGNQLGDTDDDENDDGDGVLMFLKEFGIPIFLGFMFGFWGVVASLLVKK